MGRRRTLILGAAWCALGCGGAAVVAPEPAPKDEPARAWLGVRGARCEVVLPALGLATSWRAGAVSPWRVAEQGPWCAVAATAGGAGLRIDSMAQHLSATLGLPALSLYVTRAAWSYTVFDRGEPVLSLESHVGEPLFSGDVERAAMLLEVAAEAVGETADRGHDAKALEAFSALVGLANPGAEARVVEARRHVAPGGEESPERTLARIPPGSWAALPPLGVVLVKAVELQEREGAEVATYVIVDDMTTLRVPVARAEAMGMRPIASAAEVERALRVIEDGVDVGDESYDAARLKTWLEAMGSGELVRIARVYALLCDLRGERRLYQLEDGLLATCREWLAEEIATARQSQADAVDGQLRELCD